MQHHNPKLSFNIFIHMLNNETQAWRTFTPLSGVLLGRQEITLGTTNQTYLCFVCIKEPALSADVCKSPLKTAHNEASLIHGVHLYAQGECCRCFSEESLYQYNRCVVVVMNMFIQLCERCLPDIKHIY